MKQCPSCRQMIADNARFCTKCGAKVEQTAPDGEHARAPSVRRCPVCGAETAEGAAFCVSCGTPLRDPEPTREPKAPPSQSPKAPRPPQPPQKSKATENGPGQKGQTAWLYPAGIVLAVILVILIGIGIAYLAMGAASQPASGSDGDSPVSDGLDEADEDETDEDETDEDETDAGDGEEADQSGESEAVQAEEELYVILDLNFLSLEVGEEATLTAETNGELVTWTVENGGVVTLLSNGASAQLTALAAGSTTVTATCDGVSAECLVEVVESEQETESETDGELSALTDPDGYLLPTDSRVISESELYGMSREEVALARNEIYARHGHVFETEAYREYFESKNWYTPDPSFDALDASQLTEIELENINIIVQYEQKMGWRE